MRRLLFGFLLIGCPGSEDTDAEVDAEVDADTDTDADTDSDTDADTGDTGAMVGEIGERDSRGLSPCARNGMSHPAEIFLSAGLRRGGNPRRG